MENAENLTWDDVEDVAKAAFKIFVDQPELRWAKEAWQKLESAGLTKYVNDLEYTRVAIRFLALAAIYHDFCEMAWEEESYASYYLAGWSQMFDLSPSCVGQLVRVELSTNESLDDGNLTDESEEDLIDTALDQLFDRARAEVVKALVEQYGSPEELLVSLSNSNLPLPEEEEDDLYPAPAQNDLDSVNDPDFVAEYLHAYSWIDEGCPSNNRQGHALMGAATLSKVRSMEMSKVKVLAGPSLVDGAVSRVVEVGKSAVVFTWMGPDKGWVRGGTDLASVPMGIPASDALLKWLGIPLSD
jgi:hypothetical protein